MNVSIVNALWVLLVGEKLDLNDAKLAKIVQVQFFLIQVPWNLGNPPVCQVFFKDQGFLPV